MLPSFLDIRPQDIERFVGSAGEPKFRAEQIRTWLYEKKVGHPEQMSNLSKPLREKLTTSFDWQLPKVESCVMGDDGSTKLLLRTASGHVMETVILRYEGRTSLCVSSQVGCRLACSFCQTGKLGFVRHLTSGEILSQYFIAQEMVSSENRRISHVVFMGMGEPLDNYAPVIKSCAALIENYGLSHRHVTVSTSGIVPKIEEFTKDCAAALAVSLHACRDELRSEMMPINRRYPLKDLKRALLSYQRETGKKVTIEYILIKAKNCGSREARDLVRFIHGMRAKVNLIPFNPHPGLPYEAPSPGEVRMFQKHLSERSIPAPVRYSKGLDISAACGQLAAKRASDLFEQPRRRSVLSEGVLT